MKLRKTKDILNSGYVNNSYKFIINGKKNFVVSKFFERIFISEKSQPIARKIQNYIKHFINNNFLFGNDGYFHAGKFIVFNQEVFFYWQPSINNFALNHFPSKEELIQDKILSLIKSEKPVILDVGANIGRNSIYYSNFYKDCKIYCFEPSSENFNTLKQNILLNRINAKLFKIGISDTNSQAIIGMPSASQHKRYKIRSKQSGLYSIFADGSDASSEGITLRKLDDLILEEGIINIDFIKIDVEGAEYSVLKGANTAIEKFHPILQIELNSMGSTLSGIHSFDVIKLLQKNSYKIFTFIDNDLIKIEDSVLQHYLKKDDFHLEIIAIYE
tara:strand:+ start:493 stop:1482 length:990 start_codon:yes stop_codon:yes gene_type:complete